MNINEELDLYATRIEELAHKLGLDYYPVDFELAPSSLMTEIAAYGLPIRMPHWSFGIRYIHQVVQSNMGNSKIFEVVFPGNPSKAYLVDTNTLPENTLVTAHVIGHADFSKNNQLFAKFQSMSGGNIIEHAAFHASQIAQMIEKYGIGKVEPVLDAALSLECHVNPQGELRRPKYPEFVEPKEEVIKSKFQKRFDHLISTSNEVQVKSGIKERTPIPPNPEYDLLWFISNYGPDLDQWERDIFMMVRAESLYFYPVFACQIMNEGWASYWHARLLREADFLPQSLYLSAIKAHSDVVRPFAGEEQTALRINPYHLGFVMWERIIEQKGMEFARKVMSEEDDFGFIRNYLDEELIKKHKLFVFREEGNGEINVASKKLRDIREAIITPKFNYSAPCVAAVEMKSDGSLTMAHDHVSDGRGLDINKAKKVLEYVKRVWKREVRLQTINHNKEPIELVM